MRNSNKRITKLINDLSNKDPEVRMNAAENLDQYRSRRVVTALMHSWKDPDELVRVCVAESLGYINDKKAIPVLRRMLSDKKELVRGYAASSLGMIGGEGLEGIIVSVLKKEKRVIPRVHMYDALCRLGNPEYFDVLLSLMKNRNYRVRCLVANSLPWLITNKINLEKTVEVLKKTQKKEPTIAAKSTIKSVLAKLKSKEFGDRVPNR